MTKKATTISYDATIYSAKGTKASTMTLPEKVFGLKWNGDLVHEVVTSMLANKRAGTAHTKDRSEVSGGGKKPWKQKGTGQARHGSNRSPIWVGGGITHGPRNEKDYSKKINKKARVKALFTILSKQYASGAVLLVDDLALSTIKTKDAQAVLTNLAKVESFAKLGGGKRTTTLVVVPELTDTITKSFANLAGAMVLPASELNPLILSTVRHLVIVDPSVVVPALESKMK
jgi:large subunit ribosomal protein L4